MFLYKHLFLFFFVFLTVCTVIRSVPFPIAEGSSSFDRPHHAVGEERARRICGNQLLIHLSKLCRGNGFFGVKTLAEDTVDQGGPPIDKKGIVFHCCLVGCYDSYMTTFCSKSS
ncbi:unnamed protein product [Auanema sp. JU1783]|nr:unnamed protein product [Auanema sp. JU1783]